MGVRVGERYASRVVGASPVRRSCPRDMFACMTGLCPGALRAATGLVFAAGLTAQSVPHDAHELGTVDFRVSRVAGFRRSSIPPSRCFIQMTHPDVSRAFARVAATDSACAMAYWGMAMTLFQAPLASAPGPRGAGSRMAADATGRDAAAGHGAGAAARCRGTRVLSLSRSDGLPASDSPVGSGHGAVYVAFPDDDEAASFYALALLAASPPGNAACEGACRARPGFSCACTGGIRSTLGAMHYLVHANDVPGARRRAAERHAPDDSPCA